LAHVVILGPAHPLRGGGMSTFNERLARAFMEAGHQTTIYTFSLQYPGFLFPGKTQYSDEEAPAGLDIRVRVNSVNPLNWIGTGRELKRLRPDLLVIRYWLPFMAPCLGTIARIVRKNKHTRVVAITDNVIPHEKRPGDNLLTKYFLRPVHAFVTLSESVKKDLINFGIRPERIAHCQHPLYDNFGEPVSREQARQTLGLDQQEKLVLFFGFIRDYKGLDLLMKAFACKGLADKPIKLLVAGEFYEKSGPYEQLEKQFGLQGRIYWHTHFIPNHLVKYYFCAADIVAQPYKSATQSGVTQIAYHYELPMLVTRVGGLPEMVPHMKAGLVVDPEPDAIARALSDFFEGSLQEALKEGIKIEKRRFSWEQLVMQLCEI
jgi:D-inositol-3-phosphate glycosyltransferase